MNYAIHFPKLGIHLQHVGKSVSVFGFEIAYYGIIVGIGMLLGIILAVAEAKKTKQNTEHYFDLAIYGIIFGVIGARIYYVIFSWDYYKDHLFSIFNLRQGGLAIYGGIIAAVIVIIVYAGRQKISAPLILDTISIGLVTGQMIGRWGNFFNREAFGEYTKGLFAMQRPIDAVRASDITEKMRTHIVMLDDVSYIQVHPTFLYESIWCLIILIVLVWYHKKRVFKGEIFLLYLSLYGVGRFFIEGFRTDQLEFLFTGWPVSQVLAGVTAVVCPLLIVRGRKIQERRRKRKKRRQEEEREFQETEKILEEIEEWK